MSESERAERNRLMWIVMGMVAAWGTILSLGALLFGIDEQGGVSLSIQPARGAIAFSCVAAFLFVWGVTNWWWPRRLQRRAAAEAARRKRLEAESQKANADGDGGASS